MAEFVRAQIFGTTFEITSRYVGFFSFYLVAPAEETLRGGRQDGIAAATDEDDEGFEMGRMRNLEWEWRGTHG